MDNVLYKYICADCKEEFLVPSSFFSSENCVANDVYLQDNFYVNKHTKFTLCDICFNARSKPAQYISGGIKIDLKKLYNQYAKKLGKTATKLTEAEKKQAFMDAVLENKTASDDPYPRGVDR